MPNGDDNGESEGGLYEFVAGGDACGICAGMAGIYADPPGVPVHDNCRCQVNAIDADCDSEIRDAQQAEEDFEITVSGGSFDNCGRPATSISVRATAALGFSYRDDDEMLDCEASEGGDGGGDGSADIPANTMGSFTFTVNIHALQCSGEKWKICNTSDGTYELYVGDVGAYFETPGDVTDVSVDAQPCR